MPVPKRSTRKPVVTRLPRGSSAFRPMAADAAPMPYVYPRDFATDEFITSSDLNALLGDDLRRVYTGLAAKITATAGNQIIPSAQDNTPVQFGAEVFDRGLHSSAAPDGMVLTEEGLWVAGGTMGFGANATGSRLIYLARQGADQPFYDLATQDGVGGFASAAAAPSIAQGFYGYPGDQLALHCWQDSGAELGVTQVDNDVLNIWYSTPMLWAAQLTAGRTAETWTAPRTWATTDVGSLTLLQQQLSGNIRFLRSRPAAKIQRVSGSQSVANAPAADVALNGLVHCTVDPYGMFDPSTGTGLTCKRAGIYLAIATNGWAFNTTGYRRLQIFVNGTSTSPATAHSYGNTSGWGRQVTCGLLNLALNDVVSANVNQNSGGALGTGSPFHRGYPTLMLVHLSDTAAPPTWTTPKLWGRGEAYTAADLNTFLRDNLLFCYGPPACLATRTAALSIPNAAWTTVTFPTESFDNDGMHSTATNTSRVVFNRAGLYLILAQGDFAFNATGLRFARVKYTMASGTTVGVWNMGGEVANTATTHHINGMTLLRAGAGDYAELQLFQNASAGAALNAASSFLGAVRIGA